VPALQEFLVGLEPGHVSRKYRMDVWLIRTRVRARVLIARGIEAAHAPDDRPYPVRPRDES